MKETPTPPPTIGRIVHFYPAGELTPQAAIVIAVWSDTCVNLSSCNANGTWSSRTSVLVETNGDVGRDRWAWPPRA